eukprot:7775465-Pyramimonas_sp.AAC.1
MNGSLSQPCVCMGHVARGVIVCLASSRVPCPLASEWSGCKASPPARPEAMPIWAERSRDGASVCEVRVFEWEPF